MKRRQHARAKSQWARLRVEELESRTTPSLVAAYAFNEGSGTTVADASGNGNTGTITNAVWSASGKYGSALSFNGSSSWVTILDSASLDLTNGMTVEAWVNPAATGSDWTAVALKERPNGLSYGLYATDGASKPPAGYVNTGGSDQHATGTSLLAPSTWTHLATTYDGGLLKLYVNGNLIRTTAVSGNIVEPGGPLRIGGDSVWGEYFYGLIDEVRVYNMALTQPQIQTDMTTPIAPTAPVSVGITSPRPGVSVSGSITVSATASAAAGVAGVQFLLDGGNLGAEVTSAPYSISWNTTTVASGSHTLSARARDTAGNMALASPVTVTVLAGINPATVGQWAAPVNWGLVAINMTLLDSGKVLLWDGEYNGGTTSALWDPASGTLTPVPNNFDNIFCSGHAALADGRLVVAGGFGTTTQGTPLADIFDPSSNTWSRAATMAYPRWYGTMTTLPDGRILATAGADVTQTDYVKIPEVYNAGTNTWTQLTSASLTLANYPFMYVLPNGQVLEAGSSEDSLPSYLLNLGSGTWSTLDPNAVDGGSSVMYRPGKIMKSGTASDSDVIGTAAATTYVLDTTQASPHWQQTASMAFARSHHYMTLLPDGTVLATGGGTTLDGTTLAAADLAAELWNPTTQTWTTMASEQVPRLYHSTALLLPDGRVLVAGGGRDFGREQANETNMEIYAPPYLFKGTRPTITSAPSTLAYGGSFFVQTPDAANIASVVLIRNGAVTHSFNTEQRYLPLTFTQTPGGLTVQAPADANLAPPGYYMLYIVNANGVPAVAPFVHLPLQPPTAPGNLTAMGSVGTVSLSWNPSTGNLGVAGYAVYRSTVSGFTPGPGNRIGQTTTTSYTDYVPAAGTYYYQVTAQDSAGSVSPPSNEASGTATADTTAPTVALTAPANGATVSGVVTVSAVASDDVAVAGVQFLLDGANLGSEVTVAPYSISWGTATVTNGTHTLTARARDYAGDQTVSAAVTVTVHNAIAGLVAAYSFDEGSGTTVADSSGNGNTGTLVNATWSTAGRFGGALSFDGNSSLVNIPDAPSLHQSTGMTLEAWVYPTSLSSPNFGWAAAISKENRASTSNDISYALYAANGDGTPPAGHILVGGSDRGAQGNAVLPLNTWTFLAATYDGSTLQVYVNAVLVGSLNVGGAITSTTDPLRLGGDWSGEMFTGLLDNVRIYNIALSQSALQTDMNTPVGSAGASGVGGGGGPRLASAGIAVPQSISAPTSRPSQSFLGLAVFRRSTLASSDPLSPDPFPVPEPQPAPTAFVLGSVYTPAPDQDHVDALFALRPRATPRVVDGPLPLSSPLGAIDPPLDLLDS